MALLHIPFEAIASHHIDALIQGKASESRDIEYKRESYGSSDADYAEFLADVSSFANTSGGDLLLGIAAPKGIPQSLHPLTIDADTEIRRLEDMARTGLQPRIQHLRAKAIPIRGGGYVLLIRIPRSYSPPHRAVRQGKGNNRFWARSTGGRYEPNVDELRSIFMVAPQLADRFRDFRIDRVAKIESDDTPVRLMGRARFVMHVVPFSAFDVRANLSVPEIEKRASQFPPFAQDIAQRSSINFDGVLTTSNADENASSQRAYVQVFRNGIIEAVDSSILSGKDDRQLSFGQIEARIVKWGVLYIKALSNLGREAPYAIMASLTGVKNVEINFGLAERFEADAATTLLRDQYHFAEVVLDQAPASNQQCAEAVRELLDQIANTAGRAYTPTFNADGTYALFHR